ncbi:tetratricopeptide repeat protein [bacterium]|nr:tetratricopeptide repeat protein [bacterium]
MASQEKQNAGASGGGSADQISGSKAEGLYAAGMEHYSNRRYVDAAASFAQALVQSNRHPGALKYLGITSYLLGRYPKAIECLVQFLEREPDDEQALWHTGLTCLEMVRFSEAERVLRRLVTVNPRSAQGWRGLGMIFYRRGLYGEAVNMLRKALEAEPNDPDVLFQLGEAFNKLDQVDPAVECFESVLKSQPDNPKVYYNLGILYDKKSLPERASLMYRQAKELSVSGERRAKTAPVKDVADKGLFFSRSLTLVSESPESQPVAGVDRDRYEKFSRRQNRKKQRRVTPEVAPGAEKIGTMDLTKASLKIEEALRTIKEKRV